MNKHKICVYAICKNEEKFADRWMDSMSEADVVIVTDTGSTDGTAEKLTARGALVYTDIVQPWRFDAARNISLAHVPDDADICVCTDLDESFTPGWRHAVDKAWKPEATKGIYLYNWSLKPDGTPDIQLNYFKIHARQGYKWVCPVHEHLVYTAEKAERVVYIPGMALNHYPDRAKSRGSYLPLLELAVSEEPLSDRMAYYLGREYMYKGMWENSIRELKRHLSLPTAAWIDERCASMRWIARCYHSLGDIAQATAWYYRAIAEQPAMREPYVECAQMAYQLSNWPLCCFMAQEALKIKEKSATYINMGYAWDHTPDDLCAIACYHLGMFEQALVHAKAALERNPDDPRLKENLRIISLENGNI